jgi:hypothetical protein
MSYPPEADIYPQEWMPLPVGSPQDIDEYLDYLAHIWAKEEACTNPQK